MRTKTPRNEKFEPHGYWELYFTDTKKLYYKGHYINGVVYGYFENHWINSKAIDKEYYAI